MAGAGAVFATWDMAFSAPSTSVLGTGASVTTYDSAPSHLWNRLHCTIFVRADIPSTARVPDALDHPLWPNSSYLLASPSHERIVPVLDEFLQSHGERLIRDPAKRAILARDLWSVFDWTVEREGGRSGEPDYSRAKEELQIRLAEILRRLALTPEEIRSLPFNYVQAVKSGQFAAQFDPNVPDLVFLPPDLLDAHGPWVEILGNGPSNQPLAAEHANTFSRSEFRVFLRFPQGRKAVFDYLQKLWDLRQPWIARTDDDRHEQVIVNPNLPQFPAGAEVVLLRQMLLFDSRGELESTPITESVQIRVYRNVPSSTMPSGGGDVGETGSSLEEARKRSGQEFYEIELSRPQLFAADAGGLRAIGRDEKEFSTFRAFGPDEGSPAHSVSLDQYEPVLRTCVLCHRRAGIQSLNTRERLLKPNWLQHDFDAGASAPVQAFWANQDTGWKQNRYDWGLLNGYWKAGRGGEGAR